MDESTSYEEKALPGRIQYTVWKSKNFYAIQILREIRFGDIKALIRFIKRKSISRKINRFPT